MDVAPFSISKGDRDGTIHYELKDGYITVSGSADASLATVFDFDIDRADLEDAVAAHILAALLPVLLALPLTVPIAIIDLRHRIIPNALNGALLLLGLAAAAGQDPAAWDLTGAAGAVGLALAEAALTYGLFAGLRTGYERLRGRTGLGLGDVKLVAAAMPWIGLAQLPLMILIASTSALLAVAVLRLSGHRIKARTRLPFGPFLVLGLHGAQLLHLNL